MPNVKVHRQGREETVRVQPPPMLRRLVPSPFVMDCLKRLPHQSGGFAGDFGTGFGRRAYLLSSLGYTVLAFDLDPRGLRTVRTRFGRQRKLQGWGRIILLWRMWMRPFP